MPGKLVPRTLPSRTTPITLISTLDVAQGDKGNKQNHGPRTCSIARSRFRPRTYERLHDTTHQYPTDDNSKTPQPWLGPTLPNVKRSVKLDMTGEWNLNTSI